MSKMRGVMELNMIEDGSFPDGKKKEAEFQNFVRRYPGKKWVTLEPGVGWRNLMIKAPVMQVAQAEPFATYITVNKR